MIKRGFIFFSFALVISSCKHDKGPNTEPELICNPPATVSFNNDLKPIFNQYCNTSGCHSGSSPAGNLDLTPAVAYTQLMKPSKGYVDTINPQYSVLYADMNSSSDPMPPTGKLDKCKLELVMKWIQQKAKNN